ncbi:MAG: hypothetical protein B7Y97_01100 [Sphingomonas sp. 32-66-10]|nr:MAG: hypothetical protein B7Y97_01100 [Sphingomonas sp. 32-66-10]
MTATLDEGTPVRGDVPLEMHPDSLLGLGRALDQPDTLGVSVYSSAREALRLCYDCFGRLNDAERDLQAMAPPAVRRQHPAANGGGTEIVGDIRMVNGRPTRVVNTEELIAAAERALDRVAPAVDRRVAELTRYRDTLAGRVATALDTPARRTPEGLALASEVRAHIKAMKQPAARAKFVMDAIGASDLPTVAAVLHAPPFLCGIDPAMHATIRARAAATFAPVDSAQLEAADAAIERVTSAGSAVVKRLGGVMAFRNAPVAKASRSLKALADG